jgi:hypothetical protein
VVVVGGVVGVMIAVIVVADAITMVWPMRRLLAVNNGFVSLMRGTGKYMIGFCIGEHVP